MFLTTGQIARRYGVDLWLIREVVDQVLPNCPRHGLYRMIPASKAQKVYDEMESRGHEKAEVKKDAAAAPAAN